MKDWMRFSVAFWHTFRGSGADPFSTPTKIWPWEDGTNSVAMAKRRMKGNFEFIKKLGVDWWCLEETNKNLDEVVVLAKELQVLRAIRGMTWLLWQTSLLHPDEGRPELIARVEIDVMAEDEKGSEKRPPCWFVVQLLTLIDVPASAVALQSLIDSSLSSLEHGWEVGWSFRHRLKMICDQKAKQLRSLKKATNGAVLIFCGCCLKKRKQCLKNLQC